MIHLLADLLEPQLVSAGILLLQLRKRIRIWWLDRKVEMLVLIKARQNDWNEAISLINEFGLDYFRFVGVIAAVTRFAASAMLDRVRTGSISRLIARNVFNPFRSLAARSPILTRVVRFLRLRGDVILMLMI